MADIRHIPLDHVTYVYTLLYSTVLNYREYIMFTRCSTTKPAYIALLYYAEMQALIHLHCVLPILVYTM